MGVVLALFLVFGISQNHAIAGSEEANSFAILDEFRTCSKCGKFHENIPQGELSASFRGNLPAGVVVDSIRITLKNYESGLWGPNRIWTVSIRPEDKIPSPDPFPGSWDGGFYCLSVDADGSFSGVIRGFSLGKQWQWHVHTKRKYPYSIELLDNSSKVRAKIDGLVEPATRTENEAKDVWNPFGGPPIPGASFANMALGALLPYNAGEPFSLTSLQTQSGPRKIFVVIPVYREFYNQNIGSLLISLASQELNPFGRSDLHLVFNVNHTKDAEAAIRTENIETVQFLEALSKGRIPRVRPASTVLRQAIFMVLASGMKIEVMDNTNPGYEERNIGRVRNDAVQRILAQIPPKDLPYVLISQMDGDSRVPSTFLRGLHAAFSDPSLKYALLSMGFGTERGSSLQTYRRMIMAEIWFASFAFQNAVEKRNPLSGAPRIVATAQALSQVGGVPLEKVGEDTALVRNLREAFPDQGRWLHTLAVETSFRGRPDGYDASYYLGLMNDPVGLGKHELETLKTLAAEEAKIDQVAALKDFRSSRVLEILTLREKSVRMRLALLQMNIEEMSGEGQVFTSDPRVDLGLYSSPEFEPFLAKTLSEQKGDQQRTLELVTAHFPHILQVTPPRESVFLARLIAATDTLLAQKELLALAEAKKPFPLSIDPGCVNFLLQSPALTRALHLAPVR